MSLIDLHSENTIRLLDIVFALFHDNKGHAPLNLPFSVTADGGVILSGQLMTELTKAGNGDLIPWAHKNIVSLFV